MAEIAELAEVAEAHLRLTGVHTEVHAIERMPAMCTCCYSAKERDASR